MLMTTPTARYFRARSRNYPEALRALPLPWKRAQEGRGRKMRPRWPQVGDKCQGFVGGGVQRKRQAGSTQESECEQQKGSFNMGVIQELDPGLSSFKRVS